MESSVESHRLRGVYHEASHTYGGVLEAVKRLRRYLPTAADETINALLAEYEQTTNVAREALNKQVAAAHEAQRQALAHLQRKAA